MEPLSPAFANSGGLHAMENERILKQAHWRLEMKTEKLMTEVTATSLSCQAGIRALSEEAIDSLTRRAALLNSLCTLLEVIAAALEQSVHASISGPAPALVSALVSGPAPAATTKGKAELSFLSPPPPRALLMSVNNAGKSSSQWTPYAFVFWDARCQKWVAATHLKGPHGKAKSKRFATDKAAAVYVAEQAVQVGYVHPTAKCLPTASGRGSVNMSPFDASHWVRFLLCSFFSHDKLFPNLFPNLSLTFFRTLFRVCTAP